MKILEKFFQIICGKKHYGSLSIIHQHELDNMVDPDKKLKKCGELRNYYVGDIIAQQFIDVHDPKSGFNAVFSLCLEAIKSGDDEKADSLSKWLMENYPDIMMDDS